MKSWIISQAHVQGRHVIFLKLLAETLRKKREYFINISITEGGKLSEQAMI